MLTYLGSLSVLLLLMFSGIVSLIICPVCLAIYFPLSRTKTGEAWGFLITNLIGMYLLASMVAQLTINSQNINDSLSRCYPYLSAFIVFVFTLETSIDKRNKYIKEESLNTIYPELTPEIRYIKVLPIIILPLFLALLMFPKFNVPYLFNWFHHALNWAFSIKFIGFIFQWLAVIFCVKLFFGCLIFFLYRIYRLFKKNNIVDPNYDEQ